MKNEILTKRLNNGQVVLAKIYQGEPSAVTYANRTQAARKIEELSAQGVRAFCRAGHPFYVVIEEVQP